MAIKVSLIDVATSTVLEEFEVSDIALKVLSTNMISRDRPKVIFGDWLENAIMEKIRREQELLCEKALGIGDKEIEPLSDVAKQQVASELNAAGYILPPPVKQMPPEIRDKIIEVAKVKTAAERETRPDGTPL